MFEIFLLFLRLGITGFGGPIALVSLIENAVCKERKWQTITEFGEMFSICKLLPGPTALQVAIYTGYRRGGRVGGLIAGISFIMPSILIMLAISILYVNHSSIVNHKFTYVFKFMQDATIAIICLAIWDLAKSSVTSYLPLLLIAIAIIITFYLPTFEPLVIIFFGLAGVLFSIIINKKINNIYGLIILNKAKPLIATTLLGGVGIWFTSLGKLLWICLKAGEFSFGTGLAIIPLLHSDLVTSTHWLTDKQFLDGVLFGQITPGPTTVSVIFFGYQIAGFIGAIVTTLGFYLPAFINTLILLPIFYAKLNKTIYLQIFLKWAFPAIIGGIISATFKLSLTSMTNWYDLVFMLVTLFFCLRKILPIWTIIPLSGLIGFLISILRFN